VPAFLNEHILKDQVHPVPELSANVFFRITCKYFSTNAFFRLKTLFQRMPSSAKMQASPSRPFLLLE
jgi:hypothetical protein